MTACGGVVLMIDSSSILETLSARGAIAWARISVGIDPVDGFVRPPFVVWRYSDPHAGLGDRLNGVVAGFGGSFEWRLDTAARNWTLAPSFVRSGLWDADPQDVEALTRIKETSQRSCIAATEELGALMKELDDDG